MPSEKPRIVIIADEELYDQVEDFRFKNRYPSRSAAALDLLQYGIEYVKNQKPQDE